jgi:hypothetical protein
MISSAQFNAFADSLVKQGIIEKSDVEADKKLIEQALNDSLNGGVSVVQYNYTLNPNTPTAPTVAYNNNGQVITGTETDPIKIFIMSKQARDNAKKDEENKHADLIKRCEHEWYLFDKAATSSERYSVSLGRNIDKEYFMSNPYPCRHGRCLKRFTSEEDVKKHMYQHYAMAR